MYLIINKSSGEVYERRTLDEVAFVVENETTERNLKELASEIHWSVKRCGRWDRQDLVITVIWSLPDWATETD